MHTLCSCPRAQQTTCTLQKWKDYHITNITPTKTYSAPRFRRPQLPWRLGRQTPQSHLVEKSDAPSAPTLDPQSGNQPFGELHVSAAVGRALLDMDYTAPTPIQAQVIPSMLNGHDLVGQSQTGTGKTAAFGIPIAEMVDQSNAGTQAIILVPTRELSLQVSNELRRICYYRRLRVVTLYGGEPIAKQLEAMSRGAHIVVGTPGRVLDHLGRGTLRLDSLQTVVLDEADRMLDIGFEEDIKRILQHTPPARQTVLFSATMPAPIRNLVKRYLSNPQWILVGAESEPVVEVEQSYYEVASSDKVRGLHELLQLYKDGQTLIFCRTRNRVDRLVSSLLRLGYVAHAIHGGMRQNQRTTAMNAFRSGKLKLLVATDVASRGIDIPEISHIVNYDIPQNLEEYVHRVGRTGRMGRHGSAATFVSEWELDDFKAIHSQVGNRLQQRRLALYA